MLSKTLALAASALALAAGLAAAAPLYTDKNISPKVLEELTRAQDLGMSMRFGDAVAAIAEARKGEPEHPLGQVFLIATLLSKVQEDFKSGRKKVDPGFFVEADRLIAMAEQQEQAYPGSAYPHLYLGAGYGARGLAKLYAGSYVSSYLDGKKGVAFLKEAVALEPELYDAYMGLGQFEYYCGTLGSVLQFVLALPGDPDKGLAMLKTCEEKATYAAWPCKAYRAKLLIADRKDYAGAEPELAALTTRYPGNYEFAKAVFGALDAGLNTAALRRSGEEILRRNDQGWSPPAHAGYDQALSRLRLARAYMAAGEGAAARPHLLRLAEEQGAASEVGREARSLLVKVPPEATPVASLAPAPPSPKPVRRPVPATPSRR
jgi:hypothetical protein